MRTLRFSSYAYSLKSHCGPLSAGRGNVRKSVTVFVRTRFVTFTFFGISHGRVNQVVLLNIENHAVQKNKMKLSLFRML